MSILNKLQNQNKEEKKPARQGISSSRSNRRAAFLVKQAWITEKSGYLAPQRKYVFKVDNKSNKSEIKKNIETIYGVKVDSVNTTNIKGKEKRLGRSVGKGSDYKKAIVTLKEGQKIDIMPA